MPSPHDIRMVLAGKKLTITEASAMLGMTQQNFYKHLRNDPLSDNFIRLFKEKIGLETKVDNIVKEPVVKYEALPTNTTELQVMYVPMVNENAYAGYLRGCNNPEYLEQLEKMPWLVDREYKGNYMCFTVRGDSMDDGSRSSYIAGDKLLCREVARHLWEKSRLHIRDWDFVIVHRTEGIVIKQIIEHDINKGILKLHSLNPQYDDYTIELKDVLKVFNVVQVLRRVV